MKKIVVGEEKSGKTNLLMNLAAEDALKGPQDEGIVVIVDPQGNESTKKTLQELFKECQGNKLLCLSCETPLPDPFELGLSVESVESILEYVLSTQNEDIAVSSLGSFSETCNLLKSSHNHTLNLKTVMEFMDQGRHRKLLKEVWGECPAIYRDLSDRYDGWGEELTAKCDWGLKDILELWISRINASLEGGDEYFHNIYQKTALYLEGKSGPKNIKHETLLTIHTHLLDQFLVGSIFYVDDCIEVADSCSLVNDSFLVCGDLNQCASEWGAGGIHSLMEVADRAFLLRTRDRYSFEVLSEYFFKLPEFAALRNQPTAEHVTLQNYENIERSEIVA